MKLALAIIVKDELEQIKEILKKYSIYFNEIILAVDYKFDEFCLLKNEYPQLEVYQYQWINDFSHKRNWLAEKIKSPYYFRMDTDDDIKNPENIAIIFNKMLLNNIDIIYLHYNYSRDTDGNIDAGHWRETIIKKRSDIYWKKSIHENVFIEDQSKFRGVRDNTVEIIHNITPEHAIESQARNWKILVEEYQRDGANTDPRTLAYLGRMLIGVGKNKEAIKFLELLVAKSGWEDDKYFAFIHMSQCHQNMGQMDNALACCNEALNIKPEWPDAYNRLGEIYLDKKEFSKAVHWLEIGVKKEKPETMFVLDMGVYSYRIKMNLAMAYFGHGDYEKAWEWFNISKKAAPSNEFIKSNEKLFREGFENDKYMKNLAWIVSYTRDNDHKKLSKLVEAIPEGMMRDERMMVLRNKYGTPKEWSDKSIVIYCGPAWEEWAAPSVLTGIGGSEEAVVYVSRELTRLGYSVTVFCGCGELTGTYEGVKYEEYHNFNTNDNFNILIGWRHNIFTGSIHAKRKVIWLHDVPSDDMFPEDSVKNFDKVLVLSEFHKTLLPKWVPEDSIMVSANGVNIKDFDNILLERNPHRLIYTSSYDRGLQHILNIWPDVKAEVPDAELHIFYGWNTYDSMVAKGVRSPDFKNAMVKMMAQDGVFEHGRIGHKQLAKEFAKSGIYAYPSHFEEISCISAMKAQVAGCIPVVTDYAALAETVKEGIKIHGRADQCMDDYKKALISLLKNEGLQENLRAKVLANREQFSWAKVAEGWHDNIFRK